MKNKKKVKKQNLIDLNITDVALVDKGANKKKRFFHIIKSHGGNSMNKKQVLILMKSSSMSQDEKDELLESLDANLKSEILAQIQKDDEAAGSDGGDGDGGDSGEGEGDSDGEGEGSGEGDGDGEGEGSGEGGEKDVEKAGASFSKKNKAALQGMIKTLQSLIGALHDPEEDDKMKKGKDKGAVDKASKLGDFIMASMEKKNITAEKLASAAGISVSTIGQIIRGDIMRPPDNRLRGLASALGVSMESLLSKIPDNLKKSFCDKAWEMDSDDIEEFKTFKSDSNELIDISAEEISKMVDSEIEELEKA